MQQCANLRMVSKKIAANSGNGGNSGGSQLRIDVLNFHRRNISLEELRNGWKLGQKSPIPSRILSFFGDLRNGAECCWRFANF